jgi:hypothetical protein
VPADTKRSRLFEKIVGSGRTPVEACPVYGEEAGTADLHDRVDLKVVLSQIGVCPFDGIGRAKERVDFGADPKTHYQEGDMGKAIGPAHICHDSLDIVAALYLPQCFQ